MWLKKLFGMKDKQVINKAEDMTSNENEVKTDAPEVDNNVDAAPDADVDVDMD